MHRSIPTLLTAALLAAPAPSLAREASLQLRSEVAYDDNVFGISKDGLINEDGDWSLRFSPLLLVEEPDGELQWSLEYKPRYEHFLENNQLRGWDHDVEGIVSWQITPRTSIRIQDRFRRYGLESRFNESTDVSVGDDPQQESLEQRNRVRSNNASLRFDHQIDARNVLTLSGSHTLFDRRREGGTDQESYGGGISHLFALSPRTRIGPSLSWNRRIQEPPVAQKTETDFLNLSLRAIQQFDPSLLLDVSAGPALVFNDEVERPDRGLALTYPGNQLLDVRTCPSLADGTPFFDDSCQPLDLFENETILDSQGLTDPNEQELAFLFSEKLILDAQRLGVSELDVFDETDTGDTDLTYFADITLRKFWENWTLTLGYRRSDDSSTSQFAVTSVSDRVFGSLLWTPTQKLRLTLSASWIQREQSQEIARPVSELENGSFLLDSRSCILGFNPPGATVPNCLYIGRLIQFDNVAMASRIRTLSVDQDLDSTLTSVRLAARYRLRKHLILHGAVSWRSDDVEADTAQARDVERLLLVAGVEYRFDPFRF